MARILHIASLLLGFLAGTSVALAHYQFVHYTTSTGPFTAAPEKFDLAALPNQTLYFFVSDKGPDKLAAGDSFAALLSEIRLAAKTWSNVDASALRFEFGGLVSQQTTQATPGVDVVFGDLPAGVIAMGGPTVRSAMVTRDGASFVPITRSVLVLPKDLSQYPSSSDAFFLTVVHEFGHTLGLQHTLTSSAMSTEVTRSTTRAVPLAADDVAGLSLLYPKGDLAGTVATISGRVTLNGQGVHLASVVALETSGSAVSALADPDGYYKITGLPPGQYYLYVHPLPPGVQPGLGPADLVLPLDPNGKPVPSGPTFHTAFYPDAKGIAQATSLPVAAGQTLSGFNFAVQPRGALDLYGVTTYSFPGSVAVKPAFLNVNGRRNFLAASGSGLMASGSPAPGLQANVVGGSATVLDGGVKAYAPSSSFLELDFGFSPFGAEGPRHIVFSLNNDLYVLPAAVHVVRSQPPSIAAVVGSTDEQGRQTAVVAGSNLVASTRVFFDGLPAPVLNMDQSTGALTVLPPPGGPNHRAVVTALDDDGQDSMFLDSAAPRSYTYGPASSPAVVVSPGALPAGSEAMIEISGTGTSFADGYTATGFGSSDVVVRRVWALSPTSLVANVHIAGGAAETALPLTVVSGFQIASRAAALQIQPPRTDVPILDPTLINPATGQPSIYAGGQAAMSLSQSPSAQLLRGATITLNEIAARILTVDQGRVIFEVPAGLDVGPAVLRLQLGAQPIQPIVAAIDPAPPIISGVYVFSDFAIGPDWPAIAGEDLWVTVTGLADPAAVANPGLVSITLGGVVHTASSVTPSAADPDSCSVRFEVSPLVKAGAAVSLTVADGYRVSQPVAIPVQAATQ